MNIPVTGLGQVGLVTDQPHNELPLNAWTDVRNVRFRNGAVERTAGHVEMFAGSLFAPEWLLNVASGSVPLWLYAGVNGVGATDGAVHTNITRASGAYSTTPGIGWTGTLVEDIPVINNGFDPPQMWNKPALSTKLANLTAWPNNVSANTLRGLKRYLIAFDVTKAGVRFPTMIKWSHQSPSGQVPLSWNEADETGDAGEWTLPAVGGYLVDAVPLRDALFLYKEQEGWLMQYVGGTRVFDFIRKFNNVGLLTRRCAVEFFAGQHFAFTGDDVVVHDGQNAESIMTERVKAVIEDRIDPENFHRCFVSVNYQRNEVWLCFPEKGQTWPTKALTWAWKRNIWGLRDLPQVAHIANGIIAPQSADGIWDNDTQVWNEDTSLWGDRAHEPTKLKMLMASPPESKLYVPEQGLQFAGSNFTAYVERLGLGFPTKQDGPPNYTRMKQVISLWPRISGTDGGVINVHLGTQERIGGPISWSATRAYTIGQSDMLDFSDTDAARIHTLKFESLTATHWRLTAYDADVIDRGEY